MLAATRGAVIIDTHIHLFDPVRVPYATDAPYKPAAEPVEAYATFALEAGLAHAVIVHPEPYQDDHRYLEYCFAGEKKLGLPAGFFKGTCLFDPVAEETPARMEALVRKHPGRVVALRIHEMHKPGTPSLTTGPIKDRDLKSPAMLATWRKAQALGLGIQMHFLPHYAPGIAELAGQFPKVPVILDHLARVGQGTPEEFEGVLGLAKFPKVVMKYSGVEYSAKADWKPMVRRMFDAFGPQRMIWGALGYTRDEFAKQSQLLNRMFDFATEAQRARIRGGNAAELFGW